MTISMRAAAMGLLMGCGFAGGFVLSGEASEHSMLPQFRKADVGQLAKKAAGALMTGAAKSATSGKDDGSATQILSDVAAAGGAGDGKGDGAEALAIKDAAKGKADGKDGAAGVAAAETLAQKAHGEGKTAPGDGAPPSKTDPSKGSGLVSKAAASDAAPAAKPGASQASGAAAKATPVAAAAPGGPCPMVDLAGAEAAAVLSGNTVDQEGNWGGHEFLHFSPRGLMGLIRPTTITARRWDPKAGVLCEGTACGIIHVRRCMDERLSTTKAGELKLANGRWAPILRGNLQGFPTYIPFVDQARTVAQAQARAGSAAKVKARAGDGAPVDTDRVYLAQRADSGDDGRVRWYDRDGRVMEYAVPTAGAVKDGVTINMGWWALQKGLLCQGPAGNPSQSSCYRPKRQDAGRVTLTAQDGQIDLVALADPAVLRPGDDD